MYFELLDKDKKKLADTYEVKGGKFQGENEILEIPEGEGPKTVTYGPLDIETMLEVKFDHGRDDNTSVGGVIQAKMKEVCTSLPCALPILNYIKISPPVFKMTDDNGTTRVDMVGRFFISHQHLLTCLGRFRTITEDLNVIDCLVTVVRWDK